MIQIGIPQFGLVAEKVEKVNPALVARDAGGKIYTVRYEAVNAMLLNEFLKEHRTVAELHTEAAGNDCAATEANRGVDRRLTKRARTGGDESSCAASGEQQAISIQLS